MPKRIAILILALLCVAAGVFVFHESGSRGPEYRGKQLSQWFKQYYRTGQYSTRLDGAEHQRAARAIRAMGTNAVPWLVDQCFDFKPDPPFRSNLQCALRGLLRLPPYVPPERIAWEATTALRELRPPADVLLPLVTNRLHDPNLTNRYAAMILLGCAGQDAEKVVPWLTEYLRSTDAQTRTLAVQSLSWLGPAARPAVPDLVELVRESQGWRGIPQAACGALRSIGPGASNAIPTLRARLDVETNQPLRIYIARALCQISAGQTGALEVMLANVRNAPNAAARGGAVFQLGELGLYAKPVAPVLLEAMKDKEVQVWHKAAYALEKIGETNLALLGAMERLQDADLTTRYNAMTFVLHVQPANALAISNLVEFVRHPTWRGTAIQELSKLGVASKLAIPILREAAADKEKWVREAARKALKNIEAAEAEDRNPPH